MDRDLEINKNYQFVIIKTPHEIINFKEVSDLFPKVINLKTKGYRQEYGNFVLPFDTSDFIASHLLLCEKTKSGDLVPLLGMKSVTLEKCDSYRIPFPMMGMLETPEGPNLEYKSVISKILEDYRIKKKADKIAYNGSFTILPELRRDRNLKAHLWDLTFSLLTNYYIDSGIDHVLAVCATNFKVHERKEALGWNYINGPQGLLDIYKCKALFETPLIPMEITDIKRKSELPSGKFKDLWESRLVFDLETLNPSEKIAA